MFRASRIWELGLMFSARRIWELGMTLDEEAFCAQTVEAATFFDHVLGWAYTTEEGVPAEEKGSSVDNVDEWVMLNLMAAYVSLNDEEFIADAVAERLEKS